MPNFVGTATAGGGAAQGTPLNIVHVTPPGHRRCLIVYVYAADSSGSISGITYGGTALTFFGRAGTVPAGAVEIWRLVNPAVGSATVAISHAGSSGGTMDEMMAHCLSYENVLAATPLAGLQTVTAVNTTTITIPTITLNPKARGIGACYFFDATASYSVTASDSSRINNNGTSTLSGRAAQDGDQTLSWTSGTTLDSVTGAGAALNHDDGGWSPLNLANPGRHPRMLFSPFVQGFPVAAVSTNDMEAIGALSISGVADLDATGSLLAAGALSIGGAADLDASGTLAATGALSITGTAADLDARGVLTAAGTLSINGSADLRATGTLAAAGAVVINGSASLTGAAASDMSASGALSIAGSASLNATGSLVAAGALSISGAADLDATGRLTANIGALSISGSATLTDATDIDISAAGTLSISGSATLRAVGYLTASGALVIGGYADLRDANAVIGPPPKGRTVRAGASGRTSVEKAEGRRMVGAAADRRVIDKPGTRRTVARSARRQTTPGE